MPIEKITSRKSSVVKNAAALLQKAENRSEAGLFMAEGARLCADAARSQTEIAACFFTENAAKKYKDYLDPVLKQTEHAYCIEEHIAPMLSDTKNPQGIFCVCRMPKRRADALPVSAEPDTRPCRHVLVMENIQDPSNMGNVLRTAEALGVRHLALVGHSPPCRTAPLRPSRPFRLKRETGRCGSATRVSVSQMKPSSIVMTA